ERRGAGLQARAVAAAAGEEQLRARMLSGEARERVDQHRLALARPQHADARDHLGVRGQPERTARGAALAGGGSHGAGSMPAEPRVTRARGPPAASSRAVIASQIDTTWSTSRR